MSSNIYKEEPKNSIELRRIYDMVAKISCDLANNYENPEIDTWLKHYWGAWPVDNKDKTIMVSNKDFMFYHKNGDLTYKNSEIKKNRTIWTILIH